MRVLVTGSAGHLGEALVRTLREQGHEPVGIDINSSEYTTVVGSIVDRAFVAEAMRGAEAVLHAATLHKPHVATHSRRSFVDVNVSGTLNLLEEAVEQGIRAFLFTSTTSAFGEALRPAADAPAAWITEEVSGASKNIYGVTKLAAEDLCHLFHKKFGLACLVLRTSRFFPEEDDNESVRESYADANSKLNEYLYRRVDVEDVVSAHLKGLERAASLGFGRYIVSATTPFTEDDIQQLRHNAPAVVAARVPEYAPVYAELGWEMFPSIDRVYVNDRARADLEWHPQHDFRSMLGRVARGDLLQSELASRIGKKGYHDRTFDKGPFPVEDDG